MSIEIVDVTDTDCSRMSVWAGSFTEFMFWLIWAPDMMIELAWLTQTLTPIAPEIDVACDPCALARAETQSFRNSVPRPSVPSSRSVVMRLVPVDGTRLPIPWSEG